MIILSFNTTTKTYEKEQRTEIVAGSKDTIKLRVRFGTYEEGQFVHDFDYARGSKYQVGVIFVRPDGEETWFIPLSLQSDGYFLGVLEGWVLRKSGELKVRVLNKNIDNNTAEAFIQVLLPILEGTSLDDVDFSFGEVEYDAILNSISNINYNLTRKADLDENNKVPPEQLYETAFLPEGVMFYKGKIGADEIPKRSEEHFLSFKVINKQTGETEPLSAYGIYSFLFDIYSENTEVSELREDGIPIQEGSVGWSYDGISFTFGSGNDWIFMVFNDRISFNPDVIKDNSTYEIDFKSLIHIQKGTVYTVIDPFTLNDVDYEAEINIFWDGIEWRVLGAGGGGGADLSTQIITLPFADWTLITDTEDLFYGYYTQTTAVLGVDLESVIWLDSANENYNEYIDAEIKGIEQSLDEITFIAIRNPGIDVNVKVVLA